MAYETIIYEKKEGVASIVNNLPPLNILTTKSMREITEAYKDAETTEEVRIVTIRGEGSKAFAAGLDIKDHLPEVMDDMLEAFENLMLTVANGKKPSLAIVDGVCSGGGFELAMCCDMIIATDRANFSLPEITLSLYPGIGIAVLPRKLSRNVAFEMITTGDPLSAADAHRLGLVNKLVPQDKLEEAIEKFLKKYKYKSAKALELARYALQRSYDMEFVKALKTVDDIYVGLVMKTEDANEGLNSFMEKRKPVWKHK
ncbi:MAG: enoyl-CoA hydratase/isomerase family protein [Thermodesulfobacteriota bacterium]|nr:enoyl-CoA hydratase/isomerase family protein [Thermodesulfobacteriota bacterium]